MAKRKITQRQQRRIKDRQTRHVARARAPQDTQTLGDEREGLVIAHYGKRVDIEGENGQLYPCHLRQNMPSLVTGDYVIWHETADHSSVIIAQTPPQNVLLRPEASGKLKPVAANIDSILIVIAPEPWPMEILIDRYLVAAEAMQITPTIVINKSDLLDVDTKTKLMPVIQIYQNIGYQCIFASSQTAQGMDDLNAFLADKTSVFVGQSGVGKSSLVNTLIPNTEVAVGKVSMATQRGRHTTTTTRLYHMPNGGDLIDSPGIREFGLWHMNEAEIAAGFIEFAPFIQQCKFRNCRHRNEPDCALLQAVDDSKVHPQRLQDFYRIVDA